MSAGEKVRQLLETHGHSYAEAERLTGVCRETIRRIVLGQKPAKLPKYLREIAGGYGLDVGVLLEGASPKGEFEWMVRQASNAQRLEWLLLSPAQRVKLTLDFLTARHPNALPPKVMATASGMTEMEYRRLLERWESHPPARAVALDLASTVHALTGISLTWFQWGGLSEDWQDGTARVRRLSSLARPAKAKESAQHVSCVMELLASIWS